MLVLFAAVRERVAVADVPEPFKGNAIALDHRRADVDGLHGLCRAGRGLMGILQAVLILTLLALLLGYASVRFHVEGNPIVDQIDALLPQTQCGQCGYAGCRSYAGAITAGEADINRCPPGGAGHNRTLGLRKLERIDVPIPDCDKQLWFNGLQARVAAIQQAQADNQTELDALLPAIPDRAFKGEL